MDKQQDYELTGFQESGGKTLLKFKRKFDTCDNSDRKLEVIYIRLFVNYYLNCGSKTQHYNLNKIIFFVMIVVLKTQLQSDSGAYLTLYKLRPFLYNLIYFIKVSSPLTVQYHCLF